MQVWVTGGRYCELAMPGPCGTAKLPLQQSFPQPPADQSDAQHGQVMPPDDVDDRVVQFMQPQPQRADAEGKK